MSDDIDSGGDISPDARSDISSDFGGDLASDTGADLNDDVDNGVDIGTDNNEETGEDLNESSARDRILVAFGSQPSEAAQGTAELINTVGPHGMSVNGHCVEGGAAVIEEMAAADIRQNGLGAAAELQNMEIEQAIESGRQTTLDEPLSEQDYYDENGVKITDENLRE